MIEDENICGAIDVKSIYPDSPFVPSPRTYQKPTPAYLELFDDCIEYMMDEHGDLDFFNLSGQRDVDFDPSSPISFCFHACVFGFLSSTADDFRV